METERVERLRKEARTARMNDAGPMRSGSVSGNFAEKVVEMSQLGSGVSGETEITDQYVLKALRQRAGKVGYDLDANHPELRRQSEGLGIPLSRGFQDEEKRRAEIALADAALSLKEAAAELKAANPPGRAPGNAGAAPARP
jgi:hypothetical protein